MAIGTCCIKPVLRRWAHSSTDHIQSCIIRSRLYQTAYLSKNRTTYAPFSLNAYVAELPPYTLRCESENNYAKNHATSLAFQEPWSIGREYIPEDAVHSRYWPHARVAERERPRSPKTKLNDDDYTRSQHNNVILPTTSTFNALLTYWRTVLLLLLELEVCCSVAAALAVSHRSPPMNRKIHQRIISVVQDGVER